MDAFRCPLGRKEGIMLERIFSRRHVRHEL
jgi:hypothetical protein